MSLSAAKPVRNSNAPPCGSLHVELHGAEATLRRSGALWLEGARVLVVADLHLEKGSSFAERGVMLPPYDTPATLTRLEAEAAALRPHTIVLLGDTFHDRRATARLAPESALRLTRVALAHELVWVIGNHDADGPGALPGAVAAEVSVAGLTLRHEPLPHPAPGEVSGHLHPCVRVAAAGRAVRRRAFLTDGRRLVLPAFGAYAGGLNALDPAYAPLFARPPLAGALGRERVHPIPFSAMLGD